MGLIEECRRAHPGAAVEATFNGAVMEVWHDGARAWVTLIPRGSDAIDAHAFFRDEVEFWRGTVATPAAALCSAVSALEIIYPEDLRERLRLALTPHVNLRVEVEDGRAVLPEGADYADNEIRGFSVEHIGDGLHAATIVEDGKIRAEVDSDGRWPSLMPVRVDVALACIADAMLHENAKTNTTTATADSGNDEVPR